MNETKLHAQIVQLESELKKSQEANRTEKLKERIKRLEEETKKSHAANRDLRARLDAGPTDVRLDAALKSAAERMAVIEVYKGQVAELMAQLAKLREEISNLEKRLNEPALGKVVGG